MNCAWIKAWLGNKPLPVTDSPVVVVNPKRNRAGSLASLLSDPNTYEAATLDAFLNHSPLSVKGVAAQLSRRGMYPNCTLSVIGQVRRKLKRAGYPLGEGRVKPERKDPYKQWWFSEETRQKLLAFKQEVQKCSL